MLRKRFFVFTWSALMLFLLATPIQAAQFEYYGSGIHSQSGATAAYGETQDNPGADASGGAFFAESTQDAVVDNGEMANYSAGWGLGDALIEDSSVSVSLNGYAEGYTDLGNGMVTAYGNANTVQPAFTTGIFFEIVAGEGEQIGQDVMISLFWSAYAESGAGGVAYLDGGYAGETMAVTINDYTAPDTYDPAQAVWERAGETIEDDMFEEGEGTFFIAQIGDIIGIHMGATAEIFLEEEQSSVTSTAFQEVFLDILPTAVPVPGTFALFAFGLVGLTAVRRKK